MHCYQRAGSWFREVAGPYRLGRERRGRIRLMDMSADIDNLSYTERRGGGDCLFEGMYQRPYIRETNY